MFLPLTVTLVSAPGLLVFLVARSSFFTWATASIMPLNKRALNRIRFISDVVSFSREYTTRAATAPAGFTSEISWKSIPGLGRVYFGQPPDLRPRLYYAAPSGLGRVAMLPMCFISNSRGDKITSHGAIGVLPTLREKRAKDGAPTVWLRRRDQRPGPPASTAGPSTS